MTVKLTDHEVRTATMIVSQYQAAQVRAQVAQELEAEYMALLRDKYGLDDSWTCVDLLDGFKQLEAHSHAQDD